MDEKNENIFRLRRAKALEAGTAQIDAALERVHAACAPNAEWRAFADGLETALKSRHRGVFGKNTLFRTYTRAPLCDASSSSVETSFRVFQNSVDL